MHRADASFPARWSIVVAFTSAYGSIVASCCRVCGHVFRLSAPCAIALFVRRCVYGCARRILWGGTLTESREVRGAAL